MNMGFFPRFYRVAGWNEREGFLPSVIIYTLLGYAIAARFDALAIQHMLINTVVIVAIFMYTFSINDFFDFLLAGEENFMGEKIGRGELSKRRAFVYCHIPLVSLPLLILINPFSAVLALISLSIAFLYSSPPIRLKERFGLVVPPAVMPIIFLQAHILLAPLSIEAMMLALFVFFFHLRHEVSYNMVLGSKGISRALIRQYGIKKITRVYKMIPIFSLIFSLLFVLLGYIIFAITSIFSIVKYMYARGVDEKTDLSVLNDSAPWKKLRFPGLPVSAYEFGIYGILGLLRLF